MAHHCQGQASSARQRSKREYENQSEGLKDLVVERQNLVQEVLAHISVLYSTFSSTAEADRTAAKNAVVSLYKIAKYADNVNVIVEYGAVPALVMHLKAPPGIKESDRDSRICELKLEKGSAYTLALLAAKPEYQKLIVDAGALPHLVDLLKREKKDCNSRAVRGVIRRVADAISRLAYENNHIQNLVRIEGGIPPLVELLESNDIKVQRTVAEALQTLAFKNDENKTQIVECNALPTLVLMLCSEDVTIHREAIGVIGNLVHLSPKIQEEFLLAGALQPVIRLLRSCCQESQRKAASILAEFADADSNCRVHIVQRGAVQPLIDMLQSSNAQLREISATALGTLAQDTHNQAGIANSGGIMPLLELLDSKNRFSEQCAEFALSRLADNEDNVVDLVKVGGVQKLQGEFACQETMFCLAFTLERIEEKIRGHVLRHLLYLMRVSEKAVQTRVALALAHLCDPNDLNTIFIHNNGLELLVDLLESTSLRQQRDGSVALFKLGTKATSLSPADVASPSPNAQVYLGEQYVNNPTLSDITFVVEGKQFYGHRSCLLASSDAFRAMLDGGYREKNTKAIEIPNIRWDVFELMMRYIYTGSVEINPDISLDLLKVADQYRLDGLKQLCESAIAKDICVENISLMYELSETFNAMSLRQECILFTLKQLDKLSMVFPPDQIMNIQEDHF